MNHPLCFLALLSCNTSHPNIHCTFLISFVPIMVKYVSSNEVYLIHKKYISSNEVYLNMKSRVLLWRWLFPSNLAEHRHSDAFMHRTNKHYVENFTSHNFVATLNRAPIRVFEIFSWRYLVCSIHWIGVYVCPICQLTDYHYNLNWFNISTLTESISELTIWTNETSWNNNDNPYAFATSSSSKSWMCWQFEQTLNEREHRLNT